MCLQVNRDIRVLTIFPLEFQISLAVGSRVSGHGFGETHYHFIDKALLDQEASQALGFLFQLTLLSSHSL